MTSPTQRQTAPGPWPFDPARDRYVTIIGRGRSGTNLALDVLDTHPRTICRNEANRIRGARLNTLPLDFENLRADEWSHEAWRAMLALSAVRHGERDRNRRDYKTYYRNGAARYLCEHALHRGKLRKVLSGIGLLERTSEWAIDGGLSRLSDRLPQLPVFKILTQPHWILRTHDRDPGQHVIHVVRDPAGFIASWLNRYVPGRGGGGEKVHAENFKTLDVIVGQLGGSLKFGRSYSEASLIESELWRWRYMNETVYSALSGSDRYRLWHYQDLLTTPADKGAEAMGWLGLDIDEATRLRMSQMENTLFAKPHSRKVDTSQIEEIAAAVLEGSALLDWLP